MRFCGRLLIVAGVICFTGVGAGAAPETARSADAFVDFQGVNTHYINSIYTGQNGYSFTALDQKLADLGIRHLRDNTVGADPPAFTRLDGLYANYGIHATLIPNDTSQSPAAIENLLKAHPVYEAVEGLNEVDFATRSYNGFTDSPSTNSYPATKAFQNDLYAAVKGDAQTAGLKVLSPSVGNTTKAQYLAGSNFDYASMHSYPNGRNPTFNLDTKISQENLIASPPKPIMATETGYYNKPNDGGQVSELASGKYLPRLFGEYFNRGITRTYPYELVDQNPTTDKESNFGLLHWDLTPKPAYTAVKNLNDLVKEPGAPGFSPGTLNYTLTAPSTVHHTLLEKSNGTFYLLLWNEVLSWNVSTQQDITNADVSAQLALADQFEQARTYLIGSSLTPTATYTNPTTLNLSVPDQVLVVELSHVPEPGGVSAVVLMLTLAMRRRRR